MHSAPATKLRKRIAGLSLVVAPLALLAGDAVHARNGNIFAWTLTLRFAFLLFVPATLALMHLLRERADRFGLLAGGLTLLGIMFHPSMLTFNLLLSAI